jgi:hypothetical protein
MEPIYPDNLTPSPAGSTTSPPQRGRLSRKAWLVILIGAIIVIALLAGLIVALSDSKGGAKVYYDRNGINRADLTEVIGDPAALSFKPVDKPVTYQGTTVIQACNILTIRDMRKLGLQLSPNSLPTVERTYFDGQGSGQLEPHSTSTADGDNGNGCQLPLYKPAKATIGIDVLQPPYSLASAINYEMATKYEASGSVEGFPQYTVQDEGRTDYLLRDGDSALKIYLKDIADQQLANRIVAAIAANYKREKASPKGPLQFVYDSPVFGKSYLNGCEVVTASDVQHAVDAPINPLVRENIATATGVTQFTPGDTSTRVSDIRHTCTRQAISNGYSNKKLITVDSTSHLTAKSAEMYMKANRQLDAKVSEVPVRVGDDTFFSYTTGESPELIARKGRFVISIGIIDQTRPTMSDQEMIEVLTPLAQSAVGRMKDY